MSSMSAFKSFRSWIPGVALLFALPLMLLLAGCGGNVVAVENPATVHIAASPASITAGASTTLTVTAVSVTGNVTVTGTDGFSAMMPSAGGTVTVTPTATTTYTATANGNITATALVTVSPPAAATINLTASPTSVVAGASSILTVAATNITGTITIAGSDGFSDTVPAAGGPVSVTVTPAATTTYTATGTGPGATTVSATAIVTVTLPPAPTVTISANPASISSGASSTLTIVAANATAVTVTGTDGSSNTLAVTGGTIPVTPVATVTYTANATGAAGTTAATAMATVTVTPVGPAPTVTVTASPDSINSGASSTLTVIATNSTNVVLAGSDGSSMTLTATGGTATVSPVATTTYTATASGTGGSVSASAIVTVAVAPATVSITPAQSSVAPCHPSSILTVTFTNTTSVVVTGTDGSSNTIANSGDTLTVTPTATTTYTATATNGNGSVTSAATVSAQGAGSFTTVCMTASPTSIVAGQTSTLTVTATNASSIIITGTDGSRSPISSAGGTLVVSPTSTTTYTATATGSNNGTATSATDTATVSVAAGLNITATPATVVSGDPSTLAVTASNATGVVVTGSDGSSYTLSATGGNQVVHPAATTTYTATATSGGSTVTSMATVTVGPAGSVQSINHVIFMLQENHTFDNYFGMLNPYRAANGYSVGNDGITYKVDGLDDKLTKISNSSDDVNGVPGTPFKPFKFKSTCVDDMTSSWVESYGDVNRYNFKANRPIKTDGFVHTAEGFYNTCFGVPNCGSGTFHDSTGQRAMGYYDEGFLNYYYYMASQFAVSDRWFSPMSSKSTPNRIATYTGGTTQGLVFDPGSNDHIGQLGIPTLMDKLDANGVTWKIYYTVTQGGCADADDCGSTDGDPYPATDFNFLSSVNNYLVPQADASHPVACPTTPVVLQPSSVVGDRTNSFCIDPTHIAPLKQYYLDLQNNALPSYAFIEAGYGVNDEHPGSGQSVLSGQTQVAKIANALMGSGSWPDSVLFVAYDEGGGPYDHVPPVKGHSNDNFSLSTGHPDTTGYSDISGISVNADNFPPCAYSGSVPTRHCDLKATGQPADDPADAAAVDGFSAQLGFRVPNLVISPFARQHYVSHTPMDHTAILRFVEDRFIPQSASFSYLTARDAVQPNLLDMFDFTGSPWATPPTPPAALQPGDFNYDTCTPADFAP